MRICFCPQLADRDGTIRHWATETQAEHGRRLPGFSSAPFAFRMAAPAIPTLSHSTRHPTCTPQKAFISNFSIWINETYLKYWSLTEVTFHP